jgi:hypothetical protein
MVAMLPMYVIMQRGCSWLYVDFFQSPALIFFYPQVVQCCKTLKDLFANLFKIVTLPAETFAKQVDSVSKMTEDIIVVGNLMESRLKISL